MNDAPGPGEDDIDMPALEPIQPTPPAPPTPPGPAPTVPHTGPQIFDISTPPASDHEMPSTPPPHPLTTPFVSPQWEEAANHTYDECSVELALRDAR